MRAIAVLMVMLGHFGLPGWKGWYLGVDVFFVLSGFLITSLLVEEWETTGGIALGRFYARRALRLFPAIFILLLLTAPFVPRLWTLSAFAYVANWPLALGYLGIGPISHLWSLGVEEQFYLLWPIALVGLLSLRAPRRAILAVVALLAAGSAALKIAMWHAPTSWVRLYHGSDTHADTLLVGCGLGLLLVWRMLPATRGFRVGVRVASALALAGFAALCLTTAVHSESLYRQGGLSLAALAVGVMLLQVITAPARAITALLEWRPLVGMGRISYGLYLWHHTIAWIPNPWIFGTIPPLPLFVLRFALSFAAALASYFAIERPMLRLKRRFAARSAAVARTATA